MNKLKLAIPIIGILILCGCSNQNENVNADEDVRAVRATAEQNIQEKNERMEAIREMLIENGVDPSILNERTELDNGGVILGGAKPAKEFKTLHMAEEYYGCYFGLHNKLKSLTNYSLIAMYIVNEQYLQGIYEHSETGELLVVKFSKTETASDLAEVYGDFEYNTHIVLFEDDYDMITAHIGGDSEDIIHMMLTSFKNNKAYVIYSKTGLSTEDMQSIGNELAVNVLGMDDYYN